MIEWLKSYPNIQKLIGYDPSGYRVEMVIKEIEMRLRKLYEEIDRLKEIEYRYESCSK